MFGLFGKSIKVRNNIVSHFFILKVSLPDIDSHYSQKDFTLFTSHLLFYRKKLDETIIHFLA